MLLDAAYKPAAQVGMAQSSTEHSALSSSSWAEVTLKCSEKLFGVKFIPFQLYVNLQLAVISKHS